MEESSGYAHRSYAESLAQYGIPRRLPRCSGWVLERTIPGFDYRDCMGCYPLFSCQDWSQLGTDLEDLAGEMVSAAIVPDPFGEYEVAYLRECFNDVVIPFKEHFAIDLSLAWESQVRPGHRRYVRRALRDVRVERCENPSASLEEWVGLYQVLRERRNITGLAAFSRESFARQLVVPGMVVFRAVLKDTTVGMLLWYVNGKVAYYHLGAYSPEGYEVRASYALFDRSIRHFSQRAIHWLNLGGAPGSHISEASGLAQFKEGWSNCTRTAYFCGKIFDREKYAEITRARHIPPTAYFPAYRLGEFN